MVKGKFLEFGDDLSGVYRIRNKVFCNEGNVSTAAESDKDDLMAVHVLVSENDKEVAAGRVSIRDDQFYIEKVAVLNEERKKNYGDFVVRMLVDRAFQSCASIVYAEVPKESIEFFKKIGFQMDTDKPDYEVNNEVCMYIRKNDLCRKCCH